MLNDNSTLRLSLTSGFTKGWSGFVWMLKILVPISLLTSLLAWSGWLHRLDVVFEPLMGMIGLPPMAALPLIVGLLTGIYGGIAAMAPLPLTVDQMTLLAIFLLISHNLIQEGVIQSKSGLSALKATLFRLIAAITTVFVISRLIGPETTANALKAAPAIHQVPFFAMLKSWAIATLVLSGKIFVIIIALMIILEIMKNFNLIDRLVGVMAPVLKILGLGRQTGFMWLTAAIFGLSYSAAVIVTEAQEGHLSKDELEHLHISIGINHAMIEDIALFLMLGLGFFWLFVPRLTAAIIAVQLYIILKRLIAKPGLAKFLLGHKR